ncbi:anticodon-binding domain-containing protein [Ampelomyces quisqualis]|uniref:Anticodon-binding domain-containing protein n=1 Tax=Ampelomyces quisqualis TaxID=50730 RepID=A0A6A5QL56_AMPQU|nr:anticodon-binding domain-containing protein [Ampelomyces quisqualis]
MADKRNSVAGKVATPNLKGGGGSNKDVVDADSNLIKAVGSRIKITCAPNNNVLEGTLFTACNLTNAIAINTAPPPPNPSAPLASQPGDYHIIPFAHILSFEIVGSGERAAESAPGFDGAMPSISKVDLAALQAREEQTIREMKKKDAQKGKGVSKEAQELFDAISRTLPTRWADTSIVVNDAVLIQPPYTLDSIKAPADKVQSEAHVRKVVEHYYQRKKAGSGGAARAPVAMPIAPRKGG